MPPWMKRGCALAATGLGQLMTERDNRTLDIKRIGGALALAFVITMKAYDYAWRKQPLDFMTTCQGLAVLMSALGATIAINRHTENGG